MTVTGTGVSHGRESGGKSVERGDIYKGLRTPKHVADTI